MTLDNKIRNNKILLIEHAWSCTGVELSDGMDYKAVPTGTSVLTGNF